MVKWELDRQAEAMCSQYGQGQLRKVLDSEIDTVASRANQARQESLDSQLVSEYASAMRRGDTFPTMVCARVSGEQKLVVAGGNHRHAAAKSLGETEFLAIVIDVDAADFRLLAKQLNTTNGKRETSEARAQGAADLVKLYGRTIKDAAAAMSVTENSVRGALALRDLDDLTYSIGRKKPVIAATSAALSRSLWSDMDLRDSALDWLDLKPGSDEVQRVVTAVGKERSIGGKLRLISEAIKERRAEVKQPAKYAKPQRRSLLQIATKLTNFTRNGVTLCQMQMTTEEATALASTLKTVASKIEDAARHGIRESHGTP